MMKNPLIKTFKQRDEEYEQGRLRYRLRIQEEEETRKELNEFIKASRCNNKVCFCSGECKKND